MTETVEKLSAYFKLIAEMAIYPICVLPCIHPSGIVTLQLFPSRSMESVSPPLEPGLAAEYSS